jgi:hypothetical protein
MNVEKGLLYRAFQRALLFNIPRGTRVISFAYKNDKEIRVLVVSDADFNQEDRDHIFTAVGEVVGDFLDLTSCHVDFLTSDGPIDELPTLKNVVFAMAS